MNPVQLTIVMNRTANPDGTYTVRFEIVDGLGLPRHVFVFDSFRGTFTGVATRYDIDTWPAVRDPDSMSYRKETVECTFPREREALAFAQYTTTRLRILCDDTQALQGSFPAELMFNITASIS